MKSKVLVILSLLMVASIVLSACGGVAATEAPAPTEAPILTEAPADTPAPQAETPNWITAEDISAMPDTTIRFWFYETPERIALGEQLVSEFEAKFPNIKVEVSTAPQNVEGETLFAYVKAGKNSNIQYSVNNEEGPYIENQLAYPLNNFPDYEEYISKIQPQLISTWTDGNTYSTPTFYDPIIMFYNNKLLKEAGLDCANAPKTYSEAMVWAEKLTKKDASGNVTQAFIAPWVGEDWWQYEFQHLPFYIAATGSNVLVNDDMTAAINSPQGLASFKFIEDLKAKDYLIDGNGGDEPFFKEGAAAFLTQTVSLAQADMKGIEMDWCAGPVPVPDDTPAGGYTSYAFTRTLAIIDEISLPEGEQRDAIRRASWEWIKFLMTEENMARDFAISGELPPTKDVFTNPAYSPTLEKYGFGIAMPFLENQVISQMNTFKMIDVYGVMQKAHAKVQSGTTTAEEAVGTAVEEINALLK